QCGGLPRKAHAYRYRRNNLGRADGSPRAAPPPPAPAPKPPRSEPRRGFQTISRASVKASRKSKLTALVELAIRWKGLDSVLYFTSPSASGTRPRTVPKNGTPAALSPRLPTPAGGTALTSAARSSDFAVASTDLERICFPAAAAQKTTSIPT